MRVLLLVIPTLYAFSSPVSEYIVTATPWCNNSLRLQVTPTAEGLPAAVQASAAALAKVLKVEGLDELPGALIRDHCSPVSCSAFDSTVPSYTGPTLLVTLTSSL